MEALPDMSWRRFLVLVNGLSAESRFAGAVSGETGREEITDPNEIERLLSRL